jgi:hypothetical protein
MALRSVHFKDWIADERRPFGAVGVDGPRIAPGPTDLGNETNASSPHRCGFDYSRRPILPRKEVIQPQLPLRLPCYDFVPIAGPTLDGCLLAVSPPASGVTNFHDVTGGVYKARERIHRSNADLRLLATPASCRRVSACNPN